MKKSRKDMAAIIENKKEMKNRQKTKICIISLASEC